MEDAFIDVYRESQLNGFRRRGRRKGTGQFIQEDDDADSGFIEKSYAANKAALPIPNLEKAQLDRRGMDLCRELRTVSKLTDDFRRDVAEERMSSADLLAELRAKIRPFLVRLDEEMAVQEELVKKNLDGCRITDQKVDWLLRHNKFMLEFRHLVERLTTQVYDELERLLRLKVRGVYGALAKQDLAEHLTDIVGILGKVEAAVMEENAHTNNDQPKPSPARSD